MQFLSFFRRFSGATLLFLALLSFACKRKLVDNSLPRTEESMMRFQNILTDARDGWNVCIVDKNSVRWHFWMRFHEDGKVEMKGDITAMTEDKVVKGTATTVQSSQYAIRALQQPTLTFATYNYISQLADPDILRGSTFNVDIQYAFSGDLVKNLVSTAETSLQSFALQGRLHDSKAYFTRVDGNGIIADKSLAIKLKLSALRWKDSASVNVITKGSAVNANSGFTKENIFLSDLHDGFGASVYSQVLGLTAFNRKGAAMIYYIDCEGHLRLEDAGDKVNVRQSFVDENLRKQWTEGYYDDFHWANGDDSTKLLFTHKLIDGGTENLAFESKHISDLTSVLPALQSKADEDTALFGGRSPADIVNYTFKGFTARNIRDEWNLRQRGQVQLLWSNRHFSDDYTPFASIFFFLVSGQGAQLLAPLKFGPVRGVGFIEHPNNNPYDFKFFNANYHFLVALYSKDLRILAQYSFIRNFFLQERARRNMVYKVFTGYTSAPSNVYAFLPTILGFQLHRRGKQNGSQNTQQPSGVLIPLYFDKNV